MIDTRLAQVQVKVRIQHIEPAVFGFSVLDQAAVDLDHTRIAYKHHDRLLFLRGGFQQGFH
ncbi:hypothetical protein D3C73_1574520 [compost metagenome]